MGSIIHLKLTKIQTLLKMDYCSACLMVLLLCCLWNSVPFSAALCESNLLVGFDDLKCLYNCFARTEIYACKQS